ncbi:hypothetical protein PBY51_025050 [Eleginops maclovinus]|uniref:Palladin n=2 Tax=Eleginops maclovinus TaxID=56733 RepID=A0AAN7Y275_ELEMC|nr:hypothetical protein PBY51_025050 [Eleginops maclovinus]
MQDGSWNQTPPVSLLLKDSAAGRALEADGGVFSEASSEGGGPYMDSVPELDSGEGGFADLTAFLSAEEIHRSLDLALEAFGATLEDPDSSRAAEQNPPTKASCPSEGAAAEAPPLSKHTSREVEKPLRLKPLPPVYKQDKPRLLHEGLELNDRAASASEFCSRAATFIEELSSIFRGSAHPQGEDDASSPDSGYLTPRGQRPNPAPPQPPRHQEEVHHSEPAGSLEPPPPPAAYHHPPAAAPSQGPLSPPCFLQKLKSQEVAEGSPIRLECRVIGNPPPLVR